MQAKQRGITLMGFLVVLMVVGFFVFLGIRLFPVYSEYYSVRSDMNAVAEEPNARGMDLARARQALERRFYISYVESVDLKKDVKIIEESGTRSLNVHYEVRRPLIYNLDFVAVFDYTVVMGGGGGGG
jgi:Tfp pilus assembly protein PilE